MFVFGNRLFIKQSIAKYNNRKVNKTWLIIRWSLVRAQVGPQVRKPFLKTFRKGFLVKKSDF